MQRYAAGGDFGVLVATRAGDGQSEFGERPGHLPPRLARELRKRSGRVDAQMIGQAPDDRRRDHVRQRPGERRLRRTVTQVEQTRVDGIERLPREETERHRSALTVHLGAQPVT